jgi:hypothetical protein
VRPRSASWRFSLLRKVNHHFKVFFLLELT